MNKELLTCKICGESVIENNHYYRIHGINLKDYMELHFPRQDLFTGEKLHFKNLETYFHIDFLNKSNLKKYLEKKSVSEVFDYLKNWLIRRKDEKSLNYAPGQFEARSLLFPAISFLIKKYSVAQLYKLFEESCLKSRYDYTQFLVFDDKELEIQIDTRESQPLKFQDINIKIEKLNFGDYCPVPNDRNIFVERKSLNDLCGTLSKGYERFINEIQRVKENDAYLIVAVETKYSNIQDFSKFNYMHHTKCSPDFILKRVRDTYLDYGNNLQFLAVDGRFEMTRVIKNIFNMKNDIRTVDLQYFYDQLLI